ncbi:MAG TPA: hypothetical protein VFC79_08580, partial [Tissierellaceae bacterium]|nr:hypothetical protein [Tissierellaceae bacterium]
MAQLKEGSVIKKASGNEIIATINDLRGTNRTPTSSTSEGVKGETCWDENYFYICVAANTWKR